MKKKKYKLYILFIFVFAILGYCREYFFVHLNNILYIRYYNRPSDLPVPEIMRIFLNQSYATLYYSKYTYTVLWTSLFLLAGYLAIKKISAHKGLIRLFFFSYGVLIFLSALSMLYAYFIRQDLQNSEYTLSRWLMGIAQSPIICLLLLASENLYQKSQQP